jgi:putative transposase
MFKDDANGCTALQRPTVDWDIAKADGIRQGVRDRLKTAPAALRSTRSWIAIHVWRLQKELEFLGVESSPAFVRAPEGNGCAERFIRTLKENLLWVHSFDTIEDLRQALLAFRKSYNDTWLIQRHGFITPTAFRQEQLQPAAPAA